MENNEWIKYVQVGHTLQCLKEPVDNPIKHENNTKGGIGFKSDKIFIIESFNDDKTMAWTNEGTGIYLNSCKPCYLSGDWITIIQNQPDSEIGKTYKILRSQDESRKFFIRTGIKKNHYNPIPVEDFRYATKEEISKALYSSLKEGDVCTFKWLGDTEYIWKFKTNFAINVEDQHYFFNFIQPSSNQTEFLRLATELEKKQLKACIDAGSFISFSELKEIPKRISFYVNYTPDFTEDLYNRLLEWSIKNSNGKPRNMSEGETYNGFKQHGYFVFDNWGINSEKYTTKAKMYGVDNNDQNCEIKYSIEDVRKLINYCIEVIEYHGKEKVILPEKWSIKTTEQNILILKKYCNITWDLKLNTQLKFINLKYRSWGNSEEYTEITFEQFKKYILKENSDSIEHIEQFEYEEEIQLPEFVIVRENKNYFEKEIGD